MGKGRAPCCDKSQVKRGPWSPSEDMRLITFIQRHGHDNWRALPKQAGLLRCGKSCRLRWINYLRPDLKRGHFTKEEEESIIKLHEALGNKWSKIASHFPGRTDNEIKNVWNTHLKKRWSLKDANSNGDHELSSPMTSSSSSSSTNSFTSCGKQNNIGVDEKVDHQDSQKEVGDELFTTAKDPRQQQQQRQTSCSVSNSYDSNVSNSRSAAEVSRPEDQMDSLIHYGGPYDVNNMLQEVNKPEGLEIPLEADVEFWNMLDNLDSVLSSSEVQFGHDHQVVNGCKISNSVEVENKKWLCYLENELGLDAMGEEDVVAPENFQCQIFSNPDESDPEISYGLFSNVA